MAPLYRSQVLRVFRKNSLLIALALILSLFLLQRFGKDSVTVARDGRLKLTLQFEQAEQGGGPAVRHDTALDSLTVHLVIAATASEDISWTSQLKLPGLEVIHYVADDRSARYHPPANKGREAMIYHNYFYDFYDLLPDIVILTHAQDISWHMEPLLSHSVTFALSRLNLLAVMERGYANLRVSWDNACPAYINTTVKELEEESTREAFLANFGSASGRPDEVPEILAQPCCSQFAVTRDAIRSVPRDHYARYIKWLLDSNIEDSMLGRAWEHMFQWLFTKKAVDCPTEWRTYCKMYHICFDGKTEYEKYLHLDELRADLIDRYDVGILKTIWNWNFGTRKKDLVREINAISQRISWLKQHAQVRGEKAFGRKIRRQSLYLDD
jgi:hypothetical protein